MIDRHQNKKTTEKARKTERALRASELSYRRLFEAALDGILILDVATGRIEDVNPFLIELLGFSRDEMVGKTVAELSPFKDAQLNKAIFEQLRAERHVRYADMPLQTKAGLEVQVEFVSNVYQAGDREVIQCNIRQITKRKAMEAALRESEKRYRTLFELAPVAVYYCDASGIIEEFNHRAEELWGCKPDARHTNNRFSGSLKMFRLDGSFMPHEECPMAAVLRGEVPSTQNVEYVIERAEGSRIAAMASIRPLRDRAGKITGAINCFYDITERKQAEESLRQSKEKFRQLADNIAAVFWITSNDLKIVHYVSVGYQLIWGRSTESLYADPLQWIEVILPEDRERVLAVFSKLMGNEKEVSVEYRITRPDGTMRWIHDRGFQVRGTAGELVRLTGIASDITERKRTEQELRDSREQLRALAARIQAAREEERTHAAREIHDVLAQELTALKIEASWLSRRLGEPMENWKQDILREKVSVIMDLTNKASKSVQRIASRLRPVVLDSLGLFAATEWVASDFQKRTKIRCRASVPAKDVAMDGERSTALFRILQESLNNIARHAKATNVKIRLRLMAGEVVLSVDDDGRGIRPNEVTNGRSMGLMGMRERASLLDGKCTIAPRTGGGTAVEVRIPIAKIKSATLKCD